MRSLLIGPEVWAGLMVKNVLHVSKLGLKLQSSTHITSPSVWRASSKKSSTLLEVQKPLEEMFASRNN